MKKLDHHDSGPGFLIPASLLLVLVLWLAGVIANGIYTQAETRKTDALREMITNCLGRGGHLVYDPATQIACSFAAAPAGTGVPE